MKSSKDQLSSSPRLEAHASSRERSRSFSEKKDIPSPIALAKRRMSHNIITPKKQSMSQAHSRTSMTSMDSVNSTASRPRKKGKSIQELADDVSYELEQAEKILDHSLDSLEEHGIGIKIVIREDSNSQEISQPAPLKAKSQIMYLEEKRDDLIVLPPVQKDARSTSDLKQASSATDMNELIVKMKNQGVPIYGFTKSDAKEVTERLTKETTAAYKSKIKTTEETEPKKHPSKNALSSSKDELVKRLTLPRITKKPSKEQLAPEPIPVIQRRNSKPTIDFFSTATE